MREGKTTQKTGVLSDWRKIRAICDWISGSKIRKRSWSKKKINKKQISHPRFGANAIISHLRNNTRFHGFRRNQKNWPHLCMFWIRPSKLATGSFDRITVPRPMVLGVLCSLLPGAGPFDPRPPPRGGGFRINVGLGSTPASRELKILNQRYVDWGKLQKQNQSGAQLNAEKGYPLSQRPKKIANPGPFDPPSGINVADGYASNPSPPLPANVVTWLESLYHPGPPRTFYPGAPFLINV